MNRRIYRIKEKKNQPSNIMYYGKIIVLKGLEILKLKYVVLKIYKGDTDELL